MNLLSAEHPTILHMLIKLAGHGGNVDIKTNTPMEVEFGDKKIAYERIWGRVTIDDDKATLELDDPKPVATVQKAFMTFNPTINAIEVVGETVTAKTSLGDHVIYP
jgi:hypothetical protein